MKTPLLTICIPSYNRHEKARRCVELLLQQANDHLVNIIVLDNGSAQNYVEYFAGDVLFQEALSSGALTICRNEYNIGMSANFLRAFEIAKSKWLWLISDDDNIRMNALETVIATIGDQPDEVGFIRFRSHLTEDKVGLNTLEEFIAFNSISNAAFNGSIFISNGVYRLIDFKPLLHIGYQYANTFVPHFMMIVAYMAGGKVCTLYNKEIVDYVVPELGYSYSMVAGLGVGAPKHLLLKLSSKNYKKFNSLFYPHNDYKVIIDLFYVCKRDATLYVFNYLAKNYLSYVSIARPFYKMIILRSFVFLTRSPMVFNQIIFLAEKSSKFIKKHIAEIKIRYT